MLILICVCALIAGYFIYGKFIENVFHPDDRVTPAVAINDGVDFVPLPVWKSFLIELLNIAGVGPIFGALAGAVFGPVVLLWIVFGSIFCGAVHDYMTGMISSRYNGSSLGEVIRINFGTGLSLIVQIFIAIMLILVSAVFTMSSVHLLSKVTPIFLDDKIWMIAVLIYFFLSTFLPLNTLIGKIYPVFGLILLLMAVGVLWGIISGDKLSLDAFTYANLHPNQISVWPFMFISVACGAISGFHSTQAPLMAKCIRYEHEGRLVFYGSMIAEGIIALIWAGAALAYYSDSAVLNNALSTITAAGVVHNISFDVLGKFGGYLAVIGVAICPISSGDTCLRAARLIFAECLQLEQQSIKNRIFLTVPILVIVVCLLFVDFDILWRYFAWSNQSLAMLALWMSTVYLLHKGKGIKSAVTALPAAFMTAVCVTYILQAPEGFRLDSVVSYSIGIICALIGLGWWGYKLTHCSSDKFVQ